MVLSTCSFPFCFHFEMPVFSPFVINVPYIFLALLKCAVCSSVNSSHSFTLSRAHLEMNRLYRPAALPPLMMYSGCQEVEPRPATVSQQAFRARGSDHNCPLSGMCHFSFHCLLKVFETMSLWPFVFPTPRKLCPRFPGLAAVSSVDLGHLPCH